MHLFLSFLSGCILRIRLYYLIFPVLKAILIAVELGVWQLAGNETKQKPLRQKEQGGKSKQYI